jgi:hypothetical protein
MAIETAPRQRNGVLILLEREAASADRSALEYIQIHITRAYLQHQTIGQNMLKQQDSG